MSDVKGRAREALAGVTEGPWEARGDEDDLEWSVHSGKRSILCAGDGFHYGYADRADAEFIAAAPSLISDLLSLVEEQERQLQAIDNLDVSYPCGYTNGGTVDYDDLRAILDGEPR